MILAEGLLLQDEQARPGQRVHGARCLRVDDDIKNVRIGQVEHSEFFSVSLSGSA